MTDTTPLPFELPKDTSLAGLLGMIVCWWWDDVDMLEDAAQGVYLIPELLQGETERFSKADWWIFLDAVGTYLGSNHERSELMELCEIAKMGYEERLPPGGTKCFLEDEELPDFGLDETELEGDERTEE